MSPRKGGATWLSRMKSLNKHGEEQAENASAEGERIAITMLGAARNWCGQIGVERGEANGRPTI